MQHTIERPVDRHHPGLERRHASADPRGIGPTPPSGRPVLPCRVADPELWFAESPAQLEQAKQLCHGCPLRTTCLAGALDRAEPWGVWGGEIFDHGVVIARKRPRGRPRKVAA